MNAGESRPREGHITRHGRARGAGSGWLVSIVLHGGLLFAALHVLPAEPADVIEVAENPLVLDLRTQLVSTRAEGRFVDARPLERSGVPDTRTAELLALKDPLPAVFATESELPVAQASRNVIASLGPGGYGVATARVGHKRSTAVIAGAPVIASASTATDLASGYLDFAPADTAPELIDGKQPEYPSASRRAGEEGDVQCRLHIDSAGAVTAVEVLVSSGVSRLDDSARTALLAWRFEPATHAGQSCACALDHTVRFRLR